jgi:predicted lipoprotein with Yx(FWY)xxD motif
LVERATFWGITYVRLVLKRSPKEVRQVLLGLLTIGSHHHEVMVAKEKDGASYLTTPNGMALYTFKNDTRVKSACAENSVRNWPPYHQEKVGVTGDLKASDFASITREDGKKQTQGDAALLLRARRRRVTRRATA